MVDGVSKESSKNPRGPETARAGSAFIMMDRRRKGKNNLWNELYFPTVIAKKLVRKDDDLAMHTDFGSADGTVALITSEYITIRPTAGSWDFRGEKARTIPRRETRGMMQSTLDCYPRRSIKHVRKRRKPIAK